MPPVRLVYSSIVVTFERSIIVEPSPGGRAHTAPPATSAHAARVDDASVHTTS
jgi:hypothetical protein